MVNPEQFKKGAAVLTATMAFGATEAAPTIAQEPYVEGNIPAQNEGGDQYEKQLADYCGKLASTGATASAKFVKSNVAKIRAQAEYVQDPDCDPIANRQQIRIDIVKVGRKGRVKDISNDLVLPGENTTKQPVSVKLAMRKFAKGEESRFVSIRERVYSQVGAEKKVSTTYSRVVKQTR